MFPQSVVSPRQQLGCGMTRRVALVQKQHDVHCVHHSGEEGLAHSPGHCSDCHAGSKHKGRPSLTQCLSH